MDLPYSNKQPLLLNPKNETDHETSLLTVKHDGMKETLTKLRSLYWTICGQRFIRKFPRQCVVCHRFIGSIIQPHYHLHYQNFE